MRARSIPDQAYQGETNLKDLGFNMDFAPDADVITNPQNTVIGDRSFGTDPALVGEMTADAVAGFQDQGISACIKHFPGHGQTEGDTHEGYAYTEKTLEEMKNSDLIPFQEGIKAGTDFVMVSHISAPMLFLRICRHLYPQKLSQISSGEKWDMKGLLLQMP